MSCSVDQRVIVWHLAATIPPGGECSHTPHGVGKVTQYSIRQEQCEFSGVPDIHGLMMWMHIKKIINDPLEVDGSSSEGDGYAQLIVFGAGYDEYVIKVKSK